MRSSRIGEVVDSKDLIFYTLCSTLAEIASAFFFYGVSLYQSFRGWERYKKLQKQAGKGSLKVPRYRRQRLRQKKQFPSLENRWCLREQQYPAFA